MIRSHVFLFSGNLKLLFKRNEFIPSCPGVPMATLPFLNAAKALEMRL